jgi:hypothetical protein
MSTIQLLGAGGFGALIGWYVYYINRYRKDDRKLGDLITLISIIGSGSILSLFPSSTDLFGAYGIGLFIGFFGYFTVLNIYVKLSKDFNIAWFLDGRRKAPESPWYIPGEQLPTVTTMGKEQEAKTEENSEKEKKTIIT